MVWWVPPPHLLLKDRGYGGGWSRLAGPDVPHTNLNKTIPNYLDVN